MNSKKGKERAKMQRKTNVIDAAERLFFSKGYEQSTMDDVAKEAHVSKRTIYVYFNSKEQIYFEIMIRGYRELMAMFDKEEKAIVDQNSIDKLRHMAMIFFQFSKEFPDYFTAIFSYENGESDFQKGIPDRSREECYALGEEVFGRLIGLLKEGQADGTFRSDLDVVKTALVLWSCMVGAVNTAKVKAGYIQNYHHVTPEDLVSYALQIMLQSIKGAMEEK